MTYQCFDVSITDRIAHVVLNRPDKRNNMIRAFWDELPRIIHDIDGQSRARVIVISSTGPHFSSGIDTGMFADNSIAPGPDAQRAARLQHGARFLGGGAGRRVLQALDCAQLLQREVPQAAVASLNVSGADGFALPQRLPEPGGGDD